MVRAEPGATTEPDDDPLQRYRAERWLRERLNRLRGRTATCILCGRYAPDVGATCRCGTTLLSRSRLEPISKEDFESRSRGA